jgi:Carboxypeptidase regulatory-like domain
MTPGASIGGTVTRASDGAALANAEVTLAPSDALTFFVYGTTDTSGNYSFTQLAPGTYAVRTMGSAPYQDEYYAGHKLAPPSLGDQAFDPINVTAGQAVTNVNFSAVEGGRIRGVLTDRFTGLPIANQNEISFGAYDISGSGNGPWIYFPLGATDAHGNFEITGTPDAPFTLGAYALSPSYSLSVYGCSPIP